MIVCGNGFTPSQSDLQELSDRGYLARGQSVKAAQGKSWRSRADAEGFLRALAQAASTQGGLDVEADIQIVSIDGREFGILTFSKAGSTAKPWWKFW